MRHESKDLVVGGDGTVGRALVQELRRRGRPVMDTTRRSQCQNTSAERIHLDLSQDCSDFRPPSAVTVAYLCAAVTSLEACRSSPESSKRINVVNLVALARNLLDQGAFVVYPSTNLVFDGSRPDEKSDAQLNPQTEYGRQKAGAERALSLLEGPIGIVRFSKILPPHFPLFNDWIRCLSAGQTIHPFRNVSLAPVPLEFAVDVLQRVGETRAAGVVQVSGNQDVSYEQVALHIARRLGVPADSVEAVPAKQSGRPIEHVPEHSTLDTSQLHERFGSEPPDVWATIDAACDWP